MRVEEFSALVRLDRPGVRARGRESVQRRRDDDDARTTTRGWVGEFVFVPDVFVVVVVTAERAQFAKNHRRGRFTVALCHRQRHAAVPTFVGRVTERIRRHFLEAFGNHRLHGGQVELEFCGEEDGHAAVETREIHRQ